MKARLTDNDMPPLEVAGFAPSAYSVAMGAATIPVPEELGERAAAILKAMQRKRWLVDPTAWARERCGITLWSKQRQIMEAVRDHRKVAVASCHEIGKSFSAALIVSWWIDVHQAGDAFAVTTAPTNPQVRAILWREIGRLHAAGKLPGRVNQTEWHMIGANGKEELVAFGRKPDDYNPTAFQGIHAPFVLAVGDEACGIMRSLLEAMDSLTANDNGKQLLIGNPDDPASAFHDACKPGSGFHVIHVGAFETPNFTGEGVPSRLQDVLIGRIYVEEKRRKWAPTWRWVDAAGQPSDSAHGVKVVPPDTADPKRLGETAQPFWFSKVLGLFPEHSTDSGLIPVSWVSRAQERYLRAVESNTLLELCEGSNTLGVDVGGGGDSSTVAHSRGQLVTILSEDHNPDTMQTLANVIALLRQTGATHGNVDTIGIGKGVCDRAAEMGEPLVPVNVGESAFDPTQFKNLKAELYWGLRTEFEQEQILLDPADEDTASELLSLRFKRVGKGLIQIESKDEAKRRGVPSPNRAEAVMLARGHGGREPGDFGVS